MIEPQENNRVTSLLDLEVKPKKESSHAEESQSANDASYSVQDKEEDPEHPDEKSGEEESFKFEQK